jgi:hypothetical protein
MKTIHAVSIIVFCMSLMPSAASACGWVKANGHPCDNVCGGKTRAVKSGNFTNTNPFYVCRVIEVKGKGGRAGYNLQPKWANTCTAGAGGKEISFENYACLCKSSSSFA